MLVGSVNKNSDSSWIVLFAKLCLNQVNLFHAFEEDDRVIESSKRCSFGRYTLLQKILEFPATNISIEKGLFADVDTGLPQFAQNFALLLNSIFETEMSINYFDNSFQRKLWQSNFLEFLNLSCAHQTQFYLLFTKLSQLCQHPIVFKALHSSQQKFKFELNEHFAHCVFQELKNVSAVPPDFVNQVCNYSLKNKILLSELLAEEFQAFTPNTTLSLLQNTLQKTLLQSENYQLSVKRRDEIVKLAQACLQKQT